MYLMRPQVKILFGALLIIAGVYWYSLRMGLGTGLGNLDAFLVLFKGGFGFVLFIVGVFVVWIESDELKVQRQMKKYEFEPVGYGDDEYAEVSTKEVEINTVDYDEVVDGTVDEVKEAVEEHDLDEGEVLKAEERGKDRKTLKEWLRERTG